VSVSAECTQCRTWHELCLRDQLHWLPIQQHIEYKVRVLVYKCRLHEAAPPTSPRRSDRYLRLRVGDIFVPQIATHSDLAVPRSIDDGRRSFVVSGPTLWYKLPADHSSPLTMTRFCALLKTVLFCIAYETLPQRLYDSLGCKDCCANTYTYLRTCF